MSEHQVVIVTTESVTIEADNFMEAISEARTERGYDYLRNRPSYNITTIYAAEEKD
jgi:hypothetical protein